MGAINSRQRLWASLLILGESRLNTVPLRLGAAAAILHAPRVLIFVLGRTSTFLNFDVRQEYHATHGGLLSWFWVYFAGAMSVLGVFGVLIIWQVRRSVGKKNS